MYESHWKINQRPFENRIDNEFYYPSETHQAAALKLRYAIENRRSSALLCGPSGMGKTLIIDSLSDQLGDDFSPIFRIVFPTMREEQLVRYMVDRFDSKGDESPRETSHDIARFEAFLKQNLADGKHAVVFIDEAHLLEQNELLEPLRLLLNLCATESCGESAWTLILAGQPMLLSQVERNQPLDERMSVKCMLSRLLPEETLGYVQHRLRQAGVSAESIFEEEALEKVHLFTEGIPRRINRLCDLALMVGYAEDRTKVCLDLLEKVHGDLAAPAAA